MLHRLSTACVAATFALASFVLNAQSIDLGRGELPVTVPAPTFDVARLVAPPM